MKKAAKTKTKTRARGTKDEKEKNRAKVVEGVLKGKSSAAIAKDAGITPRYAQKLEAEPETQLIVRDLLRSRVDRLDRLTDMVLDAFEQAIVAERHDDADHHNRMQAARRIGEWLDRAQGKVQEAPVSAQRQPTWEEFVVMCRRQYGDDSIDPRPVV